MARFLARRSALGRGATAMALRTRCLDDALRAFVRAGGRQVVILGAGLDARAWRLRDELQACAVRVIEVDSPGSQRAKLAALGRARLQVEPAWQRFVAHDFEADGAAALPAKLRDAGLDPAAPVHSVLEAVTMYVSRDAVAATLAAVQEYSTAEGSQLAVSYLQKGERSARSHLLLLLSPAAWAFRALAFSAGESFKCSFRPGELRTWMAARSAPLLFDKGYADVAANLGLLSSDDDTAVRASLAHVTSAISGFSQNHRFALAVVSRRNNLEA